MQKVDKEVCEQDFAKWLDNMHVGERKRTRLAHAQAEIVAAMEHGEVHLSEKGALIQTLNEPITGNADGEQVIMLEQLSYGRRLPVGEVQRALRGVAEGDALGANIAHLAALTQQNNALLGKLDYEDYALATNVLSYFL